MNNDLLYQSRELIEFVLKTHKPQAIVLMLSGGDDSMTAYHVSKELGIKIDFVIHGNTRTGIQDTTDFSINEVERMGDKLLLADAGDSYVNYVMRKGFFGAGLSAHAFTYHILKQDHFEKTVSRNIRKRQRNFPIMFINGARRNESKNRLVTMADPIKITKRRPHDIWVNIINEWHKHDCLDYLEGNSIKRNPVSVNLCRSGECMCGTMQTEGDRNEASFFYPKWGKWIKELESEVVKKFPWKWGESIDRDFLKNKNQEEEFQPMCTGCKINAGYESEVDLLPTAPCPL